ncbi:recombinase family protein [Priestia megaterium]|uniref:recombinase family protein n=1 Tax=Priestia megaterium TaxID=1404 RepID=UPI003393514F
MNNQQQNKYKVFFRRVSTVGQDLSMQESADVLYRQKYIPSEILIINEYGVSANKLSIERRPEMKKLIAMIQNSQVETIYAFDRSRLFRDFYESNYFVWLCKKYNVQIVFTSTGHQDATDSTLIEGVMNIVGDIEGKNIARRSAEARKRYPAKKFGYIKKKETKKYVKDSIKKSAIIKFFNDVSKIKTVNELEEVLQRYKKILKKTPDKLLKLATDPFYAGYDLSNGENKLSHVEPYLSLAQFKDLQTKNVIVSKYVEKKEQLIAEDIFQPYCGKCKKLMKFQFNVLKNTAWYHCSSKSSHSNIVLSTKDLICIINTTLDKALGQLDTEKIVKDSRAYLQYIRKPIDEELTSISKKKNRILQKIIIENDELTNWREHPSYIELSKLEDNQQLFLNEINTKEELLLENKYLTKLTKEYLNNCKKTNLFFLMSMLIKRLDVYPQEINIEISKFDYLADFQSQYIFDEGELV